MKDYFLNPLSTRDAEEQLRKAMPKHVSEILSPEKLEAVLRAYREPWRHFHTTAHILRIVSVFNDGMYNELSEEDQVAFYLTTLYHDVWYKVGREKGLNETKSAEWAVHDLRESLCDETLIIKVSKGIKATIDHTISAVPEVARTATKLFIDHDLMGLGQDSEIFNTDTERVWKEFAPVYTREEFDAGRSMWAQTFLAREKVYYTEKFQHLEIPARANLSRLLK